MQKFYQKSKFLLLGVLFVFSALLMLPFDTQAQEEGTDQPFLYSDPGTTDEMPPDDLGVDSDEEPVEKPEMILIADVNIFDSKIINQDNHKIDLEFVIDNAMGTQPDIRYGVFLWKRYDDGSMENVFSKMFDEKVVLAENSFLKKEVQIDVPEYLAGDYELWIESQNGNGMGLGSSFVGKVSFESTMEQEFSIDVANCYFRIEGDDRAYYINQGVDVAPDEKMYLSCPVKNLGAQPNIAKTSWQIFERGIFGDRVEVDIEQESINLDGMEEQRVEFIAPKPAKAGSYEVVFKLLGSDTSSNSVHTHYVIQGEGASFSNAQLDKSSYLKGETATLSIIWSLSADSFEESRSGRDDDIDKTHYSLSVNDKNGDACIVPVQHEQLLDRNLVTKLSLEIIADCLKPQVMISLEDEDNKVLAKSNYDFELTPASQRKDGEPLYMDTSDQEPNTDSGNNDEDGQVEKVSSTGINPFFVAGIAAILLLLGLLISRKRSHISMFFVLLGLVFILLPSGTKAATIGGTFLYCHLDDGCNDVKTEFYCTYNLSKSSVNPGGTMGVTVNDCKIFSCGNTKIIRAFADTNFNGLDESTTGSDIMIEGLAQSKINDKWYLDHWRDWDIYAENKITIGNNAGVYRSWTAPDSSGWHNLYSRIVFYNFHLENDRVYTTDHVGVWGANKFDNWLYLKSDMNLSYLVNYPPSCGAADAWGATASQPTSSLCSSGSYSDASDTLTTWRWYCVKPGFASVLCDNPKQAPACGSAAGSTATVSQPTSNLCINGGSFFDTSDTATMWRWYCTKSGFSNVLCDNPKIPAPTCGTAAGPTATVSQPTSNLCADGGSFLETSDTATMWRWYCTKSGFSNVLCDNPKIPAPTCGTAAGSTATVSQPTSNLCDNGGSFLETTDTSTMWQWYCTKTGFSNVLCDNPKIPAPTCGTAAGSTATVSQPTSNLCADGGLFSDIPDTATNWRWYCTKSGFSNVLCSNPVSGTLPEAFIQSPAENGNYLNGASINFRGYGNDPDGDPIDGYQWSLDSCGGPTIGTSDDFSYTINTNNTYTVYFRVRSNGSWSLNCDTVSFQVSSSGSIRPGANILKPSNGDVFPVGALVQFEGESNIGPVQMYEWKEGSCISGDIIRSGATENSFVKNDLSAGNHTVSFRVMVGGEWSDCDTVNFDIDPLLPQASFSFISNAPQPLTPARVIGGPPVRLSWTSSNADWCWGSSTPDDVNWTDSWRTPVAGDYIDVSPDVTTTYELNCGRWGTEGAVGGPKQLTVEVFKVSLDADPEETIPGGSTHLEWEVSNAGSCTPSFSSSPAWNSTINTPDSTGSLDHYPLGSGTYTLQCTKNGVSASKSVNVDVCGPVCTAVTDPNVPCDETTDLCKECTPLSRCATKYKTVTTEKCTVCGTPSTLCTCASPITDDSTCDCSGDSDAVDWYESNPR